MAQNIVPVKISDLPNLDHIASDDRLLITKNTGDSSYVTGHTFYNQLSSDLYETFEATALSLSPIQSIQQMKENKTESLSTFITAKVGYDIYSAQQDLGSLYLKKSDPTQQQVSGPVAFTQPVMGGAATASNHFVTKSQLDTAIGGIHIPSFGFSAKKPDIDVSYKCVGSSPDTMETYEAQTNRTTINVLAKYSSSAGWPKYNNYPIVHKITHDSIVVVQSNQARYSSYFYCDVGPVFIDASAADNPITSKADALSRISDGNISNYYGIGCAVYNGAFLAKKDTYILIFDRQQWGACCNRWQPNFSYSHSSNDIFTVFEYYV